MPAPFARDPAIVIGLLGGVAAGKTAVAGLFAERGLLVLDADRKAREVVEQPELRDAIVRRFGAGVVTADGRIDRPRLAAIVFADAEARRDLEALTHPPIRRALLAELDAAVAAGRSVVLDVPLLLEGGLIERCDVCIFVAASEPTRLARARARGWDEAEVRRREAAQAALDVKRQRCRYSIDNDRPLPDVRAQVASLLARLARPEAPR
jgi:dephospho-CoA kinase